jgi:hypothetical protein
MSTAPTSGSRRVPEPTELVYVPRPSWIPFFAAAGLTGLLVGLFAGIVWATIGAVVLVAALLTWLRRASDELSRLPRSQRPTTAVLPPIPPRRG